MRHRKFGKKIGRNKGQRKALFKNLIQALILNEEIKTTESKAKVVRRLVDKLISKAKKDTLHVTRQILAFLPEKKAAFKLIKELAPRFKRSSGFTKLTRLGKRAGDNAMMVRLEFVDRKPKEEKVKKGKKKEAAKVAKAERADEKNTSNQT